MINSFNLAIIGSLFLSLSAFAHQGHKAPHFEIRPYLQNASQNSIFIMWELVKEEKTEVHWGISKKLGQVSSAELVKGNLKGQGSLYQSQIKGLKPATRYYYSVSVAGKESNIFSFATPAKLDSEKPLRILVTSDIQNGAKVFKDDVFPKGILPWVKKHHQGDLVEGFDFFLLPGDLVQNGRKHKEWLSFFDAARDLLSYVPLYPILGNHENASEHYYRYVNLPINSNSVKPERWWFKDYSNVRIIGMDSNGLNKNDAGKKQIKWLKTLLNEVKSTDRIDFVLTQVHHPHHSELWPDGNSDFTGQLMGILAKFTKETNKPSVIFFGHTHGYSRGQHSNHGQLRVNVGGGGGHLDRWGAYNNQMDYDEYPISLSAHGFAITHVEAGAKPSLRLDWHSSEKGAYVIKDSVTLRRNNKAPRAPQSVINKKVTSFEKTVLKIENYQDVDGDALSEVQWQLAKDSSFKTIVYDKWRMKKNIFHNQDLSKDLVLSEEHLEDASLASLNKAYWRARWRDEGLAWSDWSKQQAIKFKKSELVPLLQKSLKDSAENWQEQSAHFKFEKDMIVIEKPARLGQRELSQLIDISQYKKSFIYYACEMKTTTYASGAQMNIEFLDKNKKTISLARPLATVGEVWARAFKRHAIPASTHYLKVSLSTRSGERGKNSKLSAVFKNYSIMIEQ